MKTNQQLTALFYTRFYRLIVAFLITSFFYSCQTDMQSGISSNKMATIKLSILPENEHMPMTRSGSEDGIIDMYVLVYNSAGELQTSQYSTSPSFILKTRAVANSTIIAVVNIGNPHFQFPDNIEDMKRLTTDLKIRIPSVMSGYIQNFNLSESNEIINLSLSVRRLSAKVKLIIDSPQSDVLITGYEVHNLPKSSFYINHPLDTENQINDNKAGVDASSLGLPNYYVNSPLKQFNTYQLVDSFYMYENRAGVNNFITQQQDKNDTNAPDTATYITIYGRNSSYNITWKVYLGANNTNNFNIKRNSFYTYHISLSPSLVDTRVTMESIADLSNCFLIYPDQSINVSVLKANMSPIALADDAVYNPVTKSYPQIGPNTSWEAFIVWQTSPNLISVTHERGVGPTASFTVIPNNIAGNAVVGIKNSQGRILWSWHIWITPFVDRILRGYDGGATMVAMLGATGDPSSTSSNGNTVGIEAAGLHYQWGRKDPFPHTTNNSSAQEPTLFDVFSNRFTMKVDINSAKDSRYTVGYSVANPMIFFAGTEDWLVNPNDTLWKSDHKTVFDPCPSGWKVSGKNFSDRIFYEASGGHRDVIYLDGYYSNNLLTPFMGLRLYSDGSLFGLTHRSNEPGWASYWLAYSNPNSVQSFAYNVGYYYGNSCQYYNSSRSRADGCMLRCVRE